MSEFKGLLLCPRCGKGAFLLEDWETYVSLICRKCAAKIGEADPAQFAGISRWLHRSEPE